jgi:hypothetical protein
MDDHPTVQLRNLSTCRLSAIRPTQREISISAPGWRSNCDKLDPRRHAPGLFERFLPEPQKLQSAIHPAHHGGARFGIRLLHPVEQASSSQPPVGGAEDVIGPKVA